MPKRKSKTPVSRTRQYITTLIQLEYLHSPCASDRCEVPYKHCSGCNETFPCKTAQILAGKTVAQINAEIDSMTETVTLYGDQAQEELPFTGEDGDDAPSDQ